MKKFHGLTLIYNDEVRSAKPLRERDDFDMLLTHRDGRALGAVIVDNEKYTASQESSWIEFMRNGEVVDDADTFNVIDVIDGYYFIGGDKNIWIMKSEQAEALGFEKTDLYEFFGFLNNAVYTPSRDWTDEEMDTFL